MRHRPGRRATRVLLVAAALSACAVAAVTASAGAKDRSTQAGKPVRIGVLLSATANTYEQADLKGIQDAAKKYGGKVVKVFDANFVASTQSSQVEDAITSKQYDALVIVPQAGNTIVPQVKDAIKAGLKVVCLLSPCGSNQQSNARQIPGYVTTVGYQFAENGTDIAKAIVAACGSLNPCNVAYEPGLLSFSTEVFRTNGIKAYLKKFPHIKIVAEQEGKYLANTGRTAMQNMLQAHPDVNVAGLQRRSDDGRDGAGREECWTDWQGKADRKWGKHSWRSSSQGRPLVCDRREPSLHRGLPRGEVRDHGRQRHAALEDPAFRR